MKVYGLVILVFILSACGGDPQLQRVIESEKTKISASFITENPEELAFPVKLIFAIDKSSSMGNVGGFEEGADPSNLRTKLALDYINELDQFDNYKFQLLLWASSVELGYRSGGKFSVTGDARNFDRATYESMLNGSSTSYLTILDTLEDLVRRECPSQTDINNNLGGLTSCNIIFFTDGLPTDDAFRGRSAKQIRDMLSARVAQIRDIALSRGVADFQFNTIFLVPPLDTLETGVEELANAEMLLQQMASEGNGTFTAFEDAREITYESYDFRIAVEYELTNIIAYNYMARAGLDATGEEALKPDSDGDGLPDFKEVLLGTDPTKYDTDGDGMSDFFEYTQSQLGSAGFDPTVPAELLISACNIATAGRYQDSDNDFLNDCEETLLQTELNNVDGDGDFFPDSIEFSMNSDVRTRTDIQDTDFDGVLDVVEMRRHTPIDLNAPRLQDKYSYNAESFTFDSIRLGSDPLNSSVLRSYQFDISNIDIMDTSRITDVIHPLRPYYDFLAGDNLICVWVVQAPERQLNIKPIYSRACKVVNYYNNSGELNLRPEDFEIIQF